MDFAQQERNWERLQENLPGGPGDKCLDCDIDLECEDCVHYWKNAGKKLWEEI